jgi:type IV pilus assembly protein PilC
MPAFVWEARTRTGETRNGTMVADTMEAVQQRLRAQALQPQSVKKKPLEIKLKLPGIGGGVPAKDLMLFTRQFSTMIDAGLPLVQCLEILGNQNDNPDFKRILLDLKNTVETGQTFADALKKHPKVFDNLFVNLVAAGETGGILDSIMQRLSVYIEKNLKLVKQIKGALTYPVVVLCVSFAVVAVLLLFVIPTFEKMFKDFGGSLPALTQSLIDMSQWLQAYAPYLFPAIGAGVFGLKKFKETPKGTEIFDTHILKAPLIGDVVRKVAVARFTRTMGTMLSSGVPILDSLEIVARSSGNVVIERGIMFVRTKISEGKTMAQPLGDTKLFPPMVVQMISVGEATGALDKMLSKIADFYEEEVDEAVAAMTSMIEPVMMVFLGGLLGTMMIAMYLPIFTMAGSIK